MIREGWHICRLLLGLLFSRYTCQVLLAHRCARWTTIEINTSNAHVFSFAYELNLSVAISCVPLLSPSLSHLGLCSTIERRKKIFDD